MGESVQRLLRSAFPGLPVEDISDSALLMDYLHDFICMEGWPTKLSQAAQNEINAAILLKQLICLPKDMVQIHMAFWENKPRLKHMLLLLDGFADSDCPIHTEFCKALSILKDQKYHLGYADCALAELVIKYLAPTPSALASSASLAKWMAAVSAANPSMECLLVSNNSTKISGSVNVFLCGLRA